MKLIAHRNTNGYTYTAMFFIEINHLSGVNMKVEARIEEINGRVIWEETASSWAGIPFDSLLCIKEHLPLGWKKHIQEAWNLLVIHFNGEELGEICKYDKPDKTKRNS